MKVTEHFERAVVSLMETKKWSRASAIRGLWANGRCEYCDDDLLASISAYKAWEADHIVPISAGGTDELENRALACRSCNVGFKARWNPEAIAGKGAPREVLIAACRLYIAQRREAFKQEIETTRKIFAEYNAAN